MVYLITMRTLLWVKSMYGKGQNPRKWIGHIIVYAVGLQPVGASSFRDMHSSRISHLASLTLYNFVIEPAVADTEVAFILRLKGMLARLALHGWSIDGGKDGVFPHRWHAVLALLQAELDRLHDFVFANKVPRDRVFERNARVISVSEESWKENSRRTENSRRAENSQRDG
jgi:hypothetical protein